jgi:hypothetical protein
MPNRRKRKAPRGERGAFALIRAARVGGTTFRRSGTCSIGAKNARPARRVPQRRSPPGFWNVERGPLTKAAARLTLPSVTGSRNDRRAGRIASRDRQAPCECPANGSRGPVRAAGRPSPGNDRRPRAPPLFRSRPRPSTERTARGPGPQAAASRPLWPLRSASACFRPACGPSSAMLRFIACRRGRSFESARCGGQMPRAGIPKNLRSGDGFKIDGPAIRAVGYRSFTCVGRLPRKFIKTGVV